LWPPDANAAARSTAARNGFWRAGNAKKTLQRQAKRKPRKCANPPCENLLGPNARSLERDPDCNRKAYFKNREKNLEGLREEYRLHPQKFRMNATIQAQAWPRAKQAKEGAQGSGKGPAEAPCLQLRALCEASTFWEERLTTSGCSVTTACVRNSCSHCKSTTATHLGENRVNSEVGLQGRRGKP
jgi:hypothetical protein